jgi:hypothetical protein
LDGWMDGWLVGWMDGWVDGWMDGWMDGSCLFLESDDLFQAYDKMRIILY